MEKICSITGHRPNKFHFKNNENHIDCIRLKYLLIEQIIKLYLEGNKIFLTGCAIGVDIWLGEIILNLREKYDDIKLYCIIPFEKQMERWNYNYKIRYNNLLNNCTGKIVLQKDFTKDCYLKRNKFLVDKCTTLVGIYNGIDKHSGTYSTLNYALKNNFLNILYLKTDIPKILSHILIVIIRT